MAVAMAKGPRSQGIARALRFLARALSPPPPPTQPPLPFSLLPLRLCHSPDASYRKVYGRASHGRRLGLRIISSQVEGSGPSSGATGDANQHGKETVATSILNAGVKYSVIRVNSDGSWETLLLNTSELGIHPRDIDLLAGNFFIPKRSAIAVRNCKVLVRMENVRALIYRDYCLLFDAHPPRKGIGKWLQTSVVAGAAEIEASKSFNRAREAFAIALSEYIKCFSPHPEEPMPFHLRMLECLLDETCSFFHQKVERLKIVGERMLVELTKNDMDMGGLQRLLPLRRALTEVEHDISDTHEAIDQVLGSDDTLEALCFEDETVKYSGRHLPDNFQEHELSKVRQATADMLVTYQREVDDAGGVLEELRKDMDSAQEVWELGLDTTRNRIIRMNLYITVASLSFSLATLPASFFGMNLTSGLEGHPQMFTVVVGTTCGAGLLLGSILLFVFRIWPLIKDKRRAQDLAALRELLQHIDNIDEIFQAISSEDTNAKVSREEFQKILKAHPSTKFMRQRELDLMFRMFDSNRNGFLEANELNAVSHRRIKPKNAKDLVW